MKLFHHTRLMLLSRNPDLAEQLHQAAMQLKYNLNVVSYCNTNRAEQSLKAMGLSDLYPDIILIDETLATPIYQKISETHHFEDTALYIIQKSTTTLEASHTSLNDSITEPTSTETAVVCLQTIRDLWGKGIKHNFEQEL